MKSSTKKTTKLIKGLVAGVFLASTIAACSSDNDDVIIPEASFSVTQASYDAGALDLFVGAEKVKESFEFTNTTDYKSVVAGKTEVTIVEAGLSDTVKTAELDFQAGKAYSLFIANNIENVEYVVVEDNLTAPTTGNAKVRFVNLSPGDAEFDILVKDAETNLFEDAEFKSASAFKNLAPETYTFEIRESGSDDVLFTLEDVEIVQGKIYTIWTKGIVGGEDSAEFGAQVITNK